MADVLFKSDSSKPCSSISALSAASMDHAMLEQWTNAVKQFQNLIDHCIMNDKRYEALLDEVLSSWVATRARQVAKKYIFEMKMSGAKKASRMGTPALREKLDKV